MHKLAIVLISLFTLALSGLSYAAGRVFYDGFEDGTTNKWQQDSFRNRCQVVTSAIDQLTGPFAGTRMLRCNHNNTLVSNAPDRYETLTISTDNLYTDEIFIRVRVRVDTDVSMGGPGGQKILRFFFSDATRYHDLFDVLGHPQNAFNNSAASSYTVTLPTYWGGAPGDLTNQPNSGWHKSEYYIRQSTGTVKVWHDGVLIRNDTGINFEGLKWSPFYITSNGDSGTDANNHVYFDEFEIYSDTGSGASGNMSNASITVGSATPPAAPQNLRILP